VVMKMNVQEKRRRKPKKRWLDMTENNMIVVYNSCTMPDKCMIISSVKNIICKLLKIFRHCV
jgi:hypothetical protein